MAGNERRATREVYALGTFEQREIMTKLKVRYDGWVALPAAVRRRLGVTTGDELTAEIVDGKLVLGGDGEAREEPLASETAEAAPEPEAKEAAPSAAEPEKTSKAARARRSSKLGVPVIPKARGRRKVAGSP